MKRPDRVLTLAAQLAEANIHMVGGPLPGEEALYEHIRREAVRSPSRNGLGAVVESPLRMRDEVLRLLGDRDALAAASARSRAFMAREFGEERILAPYLTAFEEAARNRIHTPRILATSARRHV